MWCSRAEFWEAEATRLAAENATLAGTAEAQREQLAVLKQRVVTLSRMLFGASSEKDSPAKRDDGKGDGAGDGAGRAGSRRRGQRRPSSGARTTADPARGGPRSWPATPGPSRAPPGSPGTTPAPTWAPTCGPAPPAKGNRALEPLLPWNITIPGQPGLPAGSKDKPP